MQRTPALDCPWPPTPADLMLASVEDTIPIELNNLLAWSVGLSDDLIMTNFVEIDDDTNVTFASFCQDIVYLASKGHPLI